MTGVPYDLKASPYDRMWGWKHDRLRMDQLGHGTWDRVAARARIGCFRPFKQCRLDVAHQFYISPPPVQGMG